MIKIEQLSKHFRLRDTPADMPGKIRAVFSPAYRTIRAVDNISLEIQKGEIVGYLGPNGAGKSTTIKLLTGILYPTAGRVEVNGIVPHSHRVENAYNIGIVFGQRSQLSYDLPVSDSLEFLGAMYRVPRAQCRRNIDLFVELLDMKEFMRQPARKLSLGQRMRAEIAAALIHDPPILFLDEPTIGLDILAKKKMLKFLQDLSAEKHTTILFTTHNLSDVEQICPRILILDKGKIALDASQAEIFHHFGNRRVLVLKFENGVQNIGLPQGKVIKEEENELWIEFDRSVISAFDLIGSLDRDRGITDIAIKEETIESILARIYENKFQDLKQG